MAQKKWQLEKEDVYIAYLYISRGLNGNEMFSHCDDDVYIKARDEFLNIVVDDDEYALLFALRDWIAYYFDELQLKRLRGNLRVKKSLSKNPKKLISLDLETHIRLQTYANITGVTLSQAIDNLLLEHRKRDLSPQG